MSDREEIKGCIILKNLYYAVDDHSWVNVNDDGTVTVGMTDVAQNMAGLLLHAKTKKVGVVRAKGRPIATVESSKWVGPVKTPISGEIIEVNEEVASDAELINRSPYKKGWLVKLKPTNLDAEIADMLTGDSAVQAYREKIDNDDLKACEHVEGFED
ncbi:MAG: glycine cleavage system protein GcvH [bacterium]